MAQDKALDPSYDTELEETLQFFQFAYLKSYQGTYAFHLKYPTGETVTKCVRANPATNEVKVFHGMPKDGVVTGESSMTRDIFFGVYLGELHPQAEIMKGTIKVHRWKFGEVKNFADSFDFSTESWNRFYDWQAKGGTFDDNKKDSNPFDFPLPLPFSCSSEVASDQRLGGDFPPKMGVTVPTPAFFRLFNPKFIECEADPFSANCSDLPNVLEMEQRPHQLRTISSSSLSSSSSSSSSAPYTSGSSFRFPKGIFDVDNVKTAYNLRQEYVSQLTPMAMVCRGEGGLCENMSSMFNSHDETNSQLWISAGEDFGEATKELVKDAKSMLKTTIAGCVNTSRQKWAHYSSRSDTWFAKLKKKMVETNATITFNSVHPHNK